MGHLVMEVQPPGTRCICVSSHTPVSVQFEYHHIWPQEYGGPSVPSNLIYLCATTHNTVHVYIRIFMDAGKVMGKGELKGLLVKKNFTTRIPNYAYVLASTGFRRIKTQSLV